MPVSVKFSPVGVAMVATVRSSTAVVASITITAAAAESFLDLFSNLL